MIYIPLIALVLGVVAGILLKTSVTGEAGIYVGLAVIAGLDSVCGGMRSALEGKFRSDVFVTGFIANIVIASFLAWFGDKIGVDVYLAAILVLGMRIFNNLSLIRRQMLTKWHDIQDRKRLDAELKAQQSEPEASQQPTAAI